MSLEFRRVPLVNPGASITSTQLAYLAEAINDRLRCNAGDIVERIVFYYLSLFRQIRNSDGATVFPPQAEFFYKYQMMRPTQAEWPVAGPGDPEGANVSSFMPAFVFGADAIGLDSEEVRITDTGGGAPLYLAGSPPSHPGDIWTLGKQQRGAHDPDTGALGSPSFFAAAEHYRIRASQLSVHGNSWGGYMPVPEEGSACASPEIPNLQIFFTSLLDGTIAPGYPRGTCPENSGDVAAVIPTPLAYYVFFFDGTYEVLKQSEWIEGPYTGGSSVRRQFGSHIPRVLNAFAADYRGTASERAEILAGGEGARSWLDYAFDTQRFFVQQYHLAPARGTDNGDGTITATYPKFTATLGSGETAFAGGTRLTNTQTSTDEWTFAAGFVLASAKVKAFKLTAPVEVEFLEDGEVLASALIEPDGSGDFEEIFVFETPDGNLWSPQPLNVRVKRMRSLSMTRATLRWSARSCSNTSPRRTTFTWCCGWRAAGRRW